MDNLIKFEDLAKQAIFYSNKNEVLQMIGLLKTLKNRNNQEVRKILTNSILNFADMSRVVRQ